MYNSHKLDEQSFKKMYGHKIVVFFGHMNDNSNFTFPITSTIPRRWPLQDYTEATVKELWKVKITENCTDPVRYNEDDSNSRYDFGL